MATQSRHQHTASASALVEVAGHKIPVANVTLNDDEQTRRQAVAICLKKGWNHVASLIHNQPLAVSIRYFTANSRVADQGNLSEQIRKVAAERILRKKIAAGIPDEGYWQDKFG